MRFRRNQKIFKMITCLVIRIFTNLFNVFYKRYYTTRHTATTAIKRFFEVVQAQTVPQIEKSAGFQVVANLITVIESVSK